MEPQERKQFVHLHRTCIFGYNRKNDGPSMSVTYYLMDDPDTIIISTMAARGKAKAVARNPKVSLCVLDEKWPPTYLQVYCDARIDATMESDPPRVIDSMMRLYDVMAGKPARSGTGRSSRDRTAGAASHIATEALRDVRDAPSTCLLGEGRGRTDALDGTADALVGTDACPSLRGDLPTARTSASFR